MKTVKVRFTEQQILLLKEIMDEGVHGKNLNEIALKLFREYARQMLGREYKK
jgi:hypothetical protein